VVVKVDNSQELKLDYPCLWQYKAIVASDVCIKSVTKDILHQRDHSIKPSNNSKEGKYASYTLSVLVHSDDDRKMLFECLKQVESIKFVL
jgi:putative lipoic acid-binding regulatory protein